MAANNPLTCTELLESAFADLDRAFGRNRDRVAPPDACTHCFDADHLAILGGPVEEIPDWLFSRALGKWGTTMSADARYWRRWTPRLLRQLTGGTSLMAEALLARKFREAGWQQWPGDQTRAVEAVLAAWWRTKLAAGRGPSAISALEFLVPLTREPDSWLRIWSEFPGDAAGHAVLELARWWSLELGSGELDIDGFGGSLDIAEEVTAWLLRELPRRGLLGDLDEDETYWFSQIALPPGQRFQNPAGFP